MVEIVKQNYKANKKIYNSVYDKLKYELGNNIPIEHVGSTAIPHMYGKNIIDILVGARDLNQLEDFTIKLKKMGYYESKHNKEDSIYRFFASTNEETKSGDIHIHLVVIDTSRYNDFIILKNYLLSNKDEAKKYADVKKNILKDGFYERSKYKSIKSKYVNDLLNRAKLSINK